MRGEGQTEEVHAELERVVAGEEQLPGEELLAPTPKGGGGPGGWHGGRVPGDWLVGTQTRLVRFPLSARFFISFY